MVKLSAVHADRAKKLSFFLFNALIAAGANANQIIPISDIRCTCIACGAQFHADIMVRFFAFQADRRSSKQFFSLFDGLLALGASGILQVIQKRVRSCAVFICR
jgi:hypothetical protein